MTTTAIAAGKLGKLPVRTDVRTLSLGAYVDRATLPPPPRELDLTPRVAAWRMYANDRRGDCTTAAAAHMVAAWTAASRGRPVEISEASVLRAFDRVRIVDPFTGDEGAFALDVLRLWREDGIGRHRIGAYAAVASRDHELVRTGAWLFGGLYVGFALPRTSAQQEVWDWTGSLRGDARPGSWGGHAVDVVAYSETGLTVVTWGRLQELTWSFWDRYCEEAYCVLSPDLLHDGRAPSGFDLDALRADLALVTA
jgi:hypothetical protein